MVQRPLFTPIVILFWCVTTGWLAVSKILPSLQSGAPPGQQALYLTGNRLVPIGWTVQWNERPLGWALTSAKREDGGRLIVDSRLHFDRLPLDEMLPAWAGLLVRRVVATTPEPGFDARGRLTIDAEGRLQRFTSTVDLPGPGDTVVLSGTVDDGTVSIEFRAGELRYETTRHLPSHFMIGDELSPQAMMPGLSEGRRWTVPVYSPLRPGHSPIEILHAEVGPEETLFWEDGLVRVHVVAYREDPASRREPRCRMWVDRSGRVLKQEAAILGATMTFMRRPDHEAARLARSVAAEAPDADDENGTLEDRTDRR